MVPKARQFNDSNFLERTEYLEFSYWLPLRLQLVGQVLLDDKQDTLGQSLDDQLDDFHYRSNFKKHLDERYQAVV